jgi:hypothetical protein
MTSSAARSEDSKELISMGTRGLIGYKTKGGFKGVYHHWDSYPSGLGVALQKIHNSQFKGNTSKMVNYLVNKHPAGYSTLAHKAETGRLKRGDYYKQKAPMLTNKTAASSGVEYAYVFGKKPHMMDIYSSYTPSGHKMIGMFGMGDAKSSWRRTARLDIRRKDIDWNALDAGNTLFHPTPRVRHIQHISRPTHVYQTGKSNYYADVRRKAEHPGRRVSKSNRVYYEYRRNRSDADRRKRY